MTQFFAAFATFIALHSIPAIPRIRGALVSRLGHGTYIAAYSAASLAALGWLFYAAFNVAYIELWEPAAWHGWVTFIAAPAGLFLVLSGLVSRNPFSTTARRNDGEQGAIVAITRHPVLWGFLLWAAGHVPPNGDLRSLLLFGGFAGFTAGSIAMMEKRGRKKHGETWPTRVQGTSITPFRAIMRGRARLRIDYPMLLGLAAAAMSVLWLLGGGHAWLFGGDPLLFVQNLASGG